MTATTRYDTKHNSPPPNTVVQAFDSFTTDEGSRLMWIDDKGDWDQLGKSPSSIWTPPVCFRAQCSIQREAA